MTTYLVPRLKPNNRLDIIGYEHSHLDPTSFLVDIKHRYPNVTFYNEPKQPFLIVSHDEYIPFVKRYKKQIKLPIRWFSRAQLIVTKHFGKDVCDLFTKLNLPFIAKPKRKRKITQASGQEQFDWVCPGWGGYYRGGSPNPVYNYNTRIDIPRMMLEWKREKQQIGEAMKTIPILAIREIQQLVLLYV